MKEVYWAKFSPKHDWEIVEKSPGSRGPEGDMLHGIGDDLVSLVSEFPNLKLVGPLKPPE
jgi:hypothetical protein